MDSAWQPWRLEFKRQWQQGRQAAGGRFWASEHTDLLSEPIGSLKIKEVKER